MKCPICGEKLTSRAKCNRCGYVVKDISVNVVQSQEEDEQKKTTTTKIISPDKIYISKKTTVKSHGFGGLFGSLFGGSIIDDILGNLLGYQDEQEEETEEGMVYDDFGDPIPIDVFDNEFVDITEVEVIDETGGKGTKKDKKSSGNKKKKNNDSDDTTKK